MYERTEKPIIFKESILRISITKLILFIALFNMLRKCNMYINIYVYSSRIFFFSNYRNKQKLLDAQHIVEHRQQTASTCPYYQRIALRHSVKTTLRYRAKNKRDSRLIKKPVSLKCHHRPPDSYPPSQPQLFTDSTLPTPTTHHLIFKARLSIEQ